ncbi:MAG: FkbM family methyltransferase [Solirubrobacterales bacterium]|nr:FkbM family methyltransferase [Solirubrobacterales bacterium]
MNVSGRDDSSSLLAIGKRQEQEFPGTGTDHTIEVPVSTLDDETSRPLARPALLKMDVQGFELDALRGATATLEEVDVALIECSFVELYEGQALAGEVVNFMTEAGFTLDGVYEIAYSADGSAVQGDFLFRRA